MAATYAMYNYLPEMVADYAVTLDNALQIIVEERGFKNQVINKGDDGSEERITFSSSSIFYIGVQWPNKTASSIELIVDWYHDTDKADGMDRTFQWAHPVDGHIYVVRFNTDLTRTIRRSLIQGIPNCEFAVLGTIS